jgi:DNA-directed RNA polymerase specialized sigma24 family protein
LGISVGTVKSRLHYALARLRAGLQRRGLLEA